jgi:hypothetical protein
LTGNEIDGRKVAEEERKLKRRKVLRLEHEEKTRFEAQSQTKVGPGKTLGYRR